MPPSLRKRAKGAGRPKAPATSTHPLYLARERAGMTTQDLSGATGISLRSIAYWENGAHLPTPLAARVLAPVLGFTSGDELRTACEQWRETHPPHIVI